MKMLVLVLTLVCLGLTTAAAFAFDGSRGWQAVDPVAVAYADDDDDDDDRDDDDDDDDDRDDDDDDDWGDDDRR